jgi:hypothetical protein
MRSGRVGANRGPAARLGRGGVELRYDISRGGDVVTLSDTRSALVVRVLTTASNAYEMTVKGEDVIRRTWNTRMTFAAEWG